MGFDQKNKQVLVDFDQRIGFWLILAEKNWVLTERSGCGFGFWLILAEKVVLVDFGWKPSFWLIWAHLGFEIRFYFFDLKTGPTTI